MQKYFISVCLLVMLLCAVSCSQARLPQSELPTLPLNSPVREQQNSTKAAKSGTAFFIAPHILVTSYHVVSGTQQQFIVIDGKPVYAQMISFNPEWDIAILVTEWYSKYALPIAQNPSRVGEEVFTTGFPRPDSMGMSPKTTFGRINAVSGLYDSKLVYQIDVPIQPGNSGGPLLNSSGEVVGIIASRMNGNFHSVYYAVKSEYLIRMIRGSKFEHVLGDYVMHGMPLIAHIDYSQVTVVPIIAQ